MAQWDRKTPWRQGSLLTDAALRALCADLSDPRAVGIVISHSCDVAQSPEAEPLVEIVVGKLIDSLDGNFTHAKTSRTLHLVVETSQGSPIPIELRASNKRAVRKQKLSEFLPDNKRIIPIREYQTFQIWLATRYRRAAFPTEFDRRLDSGIRNKLFKLLKSIGKSIECIYFDLDKGEEIERQGADDVYVLAISLVYTLEENENAAEIAEDAAKKINSILRSKYWNESRKSWEWIELDLIECISTESLSYAAMKRLKKWSADHISLGADERPSIPE